MRLFVFFFFACLFLTATAYAESPRSVQITATPLEVTKNALHSIRPLKLRTIFTLTAQDEGFGGFSDLLLSKDGTRFLALSDTGQVLIGTVQKDQYGQVVGFAKTAIFPLLGPDGKGMKVKTLADAESAAWAPGFEAIYIAFENRHRIWRYTLDEQDFTSLSRAIPHAMNIAPTLAKLPPNGGIEAMTGTANGALLMLSEEGEARGGGRLSWLYKQGASQAFTYKNPAPYVPTEAVFLEPDKILVLNRRYSPVSGASAVLSWIDFHDVKLGGKAVSHDIARLLPDFPVDNFEALAVHPMANGDLELFIMSDDNFNLLQRTIFMQAILPKEALQQ